MNIQRANLTHYLPTTETDALSLCHFSSQMKTPQLLEQPDYGANTWKINFTWIITLYSYKDYCVAFDSFFTAYMCNSHKRCIDCYRLISLYFPFPEVFKASTGCTCK